MWETVKLGDVCNIDKKRYTNGASPYVGLEDIESGTGRFTGTVEPKQVGSATFSFTKEHLLFGRLRPYLNKLMLPDFDGHCSSEIFPLRATPKLCRKFLSYWLIADTTVAEIDRTCTGARMPRANLNEVMRFNFPLPPLPEQQRIVAILDEAFAGIDAAVANAEKNLANARELFESYLNNVFTQKGEGWGEKKLGELGKITSSKRIFKNEYVEAGIPFYRTKEIKERANGRNVTTELFISHEKFHEIRERFGAPVAGEVLMTAIGTIGEIYVVEPGDEFYFKDGNVLWLKDFDGVEPHFLKFALMSFVDGLQRMSHGSAYNALPIEKLKEHILSIPCEDEQKDVVGKLKTIQADVQHLQAIYQQKLDALAELKQSILQKAFSGELTRENIAA
jgi:type I restriction enzyme, S subunit